VNPERAKYISLWRFFKANQHNQAGYFLIKYLSCLVKELPAGDNNVKRFFAKAKAEWGADPGAGSRGLYSN
jgi:hypothetical protein